MVTAHVEESAQHVVLAADDDDRLAARKLAGDVVAGRTQLIEAAAILPASAEDRAELEIQHARVGVPRRGKGEGLLERRVPVVEVDDLLEGPFHIAGCQIMRPSTALAPASSQSRGRGSTTSAEAHGIDVSVNERRNGLTVQGGTSSGRRLQDNCEVRSACRRPS